MLPQTVCGEWTCDRFTTRRQYRYQCRSSAAREATRETCPRLFQFLRATSEAPSSVQTPSLRQILMPALLLKLIKLRTVSRAPRRMSRSRPIASSRLCRDVQSLQSPIISTRPKDMSPVTPSSTQRTQQTVWPPRAEQHPSALAYTIADRTAGVIVTRVAHLLLRISRKDSLSV